MVRGTARHVATRGGPPMGKYMNRPSIEYTGSGDQLCYDGFGGRWFRASIEAVQEGIHFFREMYYEVPDSPHEFEGNYVSYNDLYGLWNIEVSILGDEYGYSPSEQAKIDDLTFTTVLVKPGENDIADKMGESVYIITPDEFPWASFREY